MRLVLDVLSQPRGELAIALEDDDGEEVMKARLSDLVSELVTEFEFEPEERRFIADRLREVGQVARLA